MASQKELMISGKFYDTTDPEIYGLRCKAHKLSNEYNATCDTDTEKRDKIIRELITNFGKDAYIQGPIQIDYGCFTSFGDRSYANFNLTILDTCPVTIGNDVYIGPNVSFLTPMHPLRWQDRNCFYNKEGKLTDREYGKPIVVEDNCWLAGDVTVCGGVTIGEGSVIGAGSVVTRDIPPNSLAAGNPCKVIREITEEDKM